MEGGSGRIEACWARERAEKESKGGEQTRKIFWKMVYGNFFHKPFSFFSFAFLR